MVATSPSRVAGRYPARRSTSYSSKAQADTTMVARTAVAAVPMAKQAKATARISRPVRTRVMVSGSPVPGVGGSSGALVRMRVGAGASATGTGSASTSASTTAAVGPDGTGSSKSYRSECSERLVSRAPTRAWSSASEATSKSSSQSSPLSRQRGPRLAHASSSASVPSVTSARGISPVGGSVQCGSSAESSVSKVMRSAAAASAGSGLSGSAGGEGGGSAEATGADGAGLPGGAWEGGGANTSSVLVSTVTSGSVT